MAVEVNSFGRVYTVDEARIYSLKNKNGMEVQVTNLGAVIVRLMVPDKKGKVADLVLGFDKAQDYRKNKSFFGAVIGPSANRIGNATYKIDGVEYHADVNDGPNNLHSDFKNGYHKRLWNATTGDNFVTFSLEDEDGNMGFPGTKRIQITYTLTEDNALELHYHGSSDKKTILNLTNHTYFNLDGHDAGNIEDHELQLNCSNYTPVVKGAIPTGEIAPVAGTVMDFTKSKKVGKDINENFKQLKLTKGYDHNWVIDGWDGKLREFARVKGPKSGRVMTCYTTLPGVQFYAGNCIATQTGKDGVVYGKRSGLCLETQYYPDTINHKNFPSCVFGGKKEYDSVTVYKFS